jgi:ferrochelatase
MMAGMGSSEGKKVGILLGQVGTPDAPTKKAVRTYLRQFLSDPRVIDLHPFIWKPILHGIVLRTRPATSARMYEEIWTVDGSPLLAYSNKLIQRLQERLGKDYAVELGMAYGSPSIPDAVKSLEKGGVKELIALPLFPQFSTATTASVLDEIYVAISGRTWRKRAITKKEILPMTFVGPFYEHPGYIRLLAAHIRAYIEGLSQVPDKYLLTFHGLPKRYVLEGDPYEAHCKKTAELLVAELGWSSDKWTIAFQSRFGKQEWLQPYAEPLIRGLHEQGIVRPCIIPLSFVTDCLETVHELGILYRKVFAEGGGDPDQYSVVPCLNDDPAWVEFLVHLIQSNVGREP